MIKDRLFEHKSILPILLISIFCCCGFISNESTFTDPPLSIIVYKGANFSSSSSKLSKSLRRLKYINKNNALSSVIVHESTIARLYSGSNYQGCYFEVVGPSKVPSFDKLNCGCCPVDSDGWDNEISSIKLYANSHDRTPGIYGKFDQPAKIYPFNLGSNHSMGYF